METQLGTHRGPRRDILLALKRSQPLSARELANHVGVSVNAIRHHLKELEAESLVVYAREQRGVGAPTYVYRLSEAGEALFPKRYEETLTRLLDHVAAKDGRPAAVAALEQEYAELARRLSAEVAGLPPRARVEAVARTMEEAGYMAEWQDAEGGFRLTEHNCAIRAVAERFPEICEAEARFFRQVLTADVERQAHIVSGCNACEYAFIFDEATRAAVPQTASSEEQG